MDLAAYYMPIKMTHVACVATSGVLFTARGAWVLGSDRPFGRWLRVAPHVVDTLLLASGLTLAFLIQQYPFVNSGWLTAKIVGLIVYIALGMTLFRGPRSRVVRASAGVAALLVFGYIVSVAVSKQTTGFLVFG